MQALLFRCACGAGLRDFVAEHATHVWNGTVYCSARCMARAQTVAKCSELGIPAPLFSLPHHFTPHATGDP